MLQFHRKKLHGRRLDYDCKKRKQLEKGGLDDAVVVAVVTPHRMHSIDAAYCY